MVIICPSGGSKHKQKPTHRCARKYTHRERITSLQQGNREMKFPAPFISHALHCHHHVCHLLLFQEPPPPKNTRHTGMVDCNCPRVRDETKQMGVGNNVCTGDGPCNPSRSLSPDRSHRSRKTHDTQEGRLPLPKREQVGGENPTTFPLCLLAF